MGLYIIATPIGNLKDITLRALEILKQVDVIAAEDTRVTRKLLTHYGISKPLLAFHEYSKRADLERILKILKEGRNVAYVVDAGTPGISDPGSFLVRELAKQLPDITITPIPGPSALTAALSIAGLREDKFLFLGFPPHKKGRRAYLNQVFEAKYPVVIFESPYRIKKTVAELCDIGLSNIEAVLIKEISKVYEKIVRNNMSGIRKFLEDEKKLRGEYVLVINKTKG